MRGMRAAHARLDAYSHHPYPVTRGRDAVELRGPACRYCKGVLTLANLPLLLKEVQRDFGGEADLADRVRLPDEPARPGSASRPHGAERVRVGGGAPGQERALRRRADPLHGPGRAGALRLAERLPYFRFGALKPASSATCSRSRRSRGAAAARRSGARCVRDTARRSTTSSGSSVDAGSTVAGYRRTSWRAVLRSRGERRSRRSVPGLLAGQQGREPRAHDSLTSTQRCFAGRGQHRVGEQRGAQAVGERRHTRDRGASGALVASARSVSVRVALGMAAGQEGEARGAADKVAGSRPTSVTASRVPHQTPRTTAPIAPWSVSNWMNGERLRSLRDVPGARAPR